MRIPAVKRAIESVPELQGTTVCDTAQATGMDDGVVNGHGAAKETPINDCSPKKGKRKLVLHFDVRNTVLVADSVTNVSVEQALNSYLTGVTWGKNTPEGWTWVSSTPSTKAPTSDSLTYYKYMENKLVKEPKDRAVLRRVTGDFTQENIGCMFSDYFHKHLKLLAWPHNPATYTETDRKITMHGNDGKLYHYILPSFFKLIHRLHDEGRDFSVIFRTYGLDAPNVLECLALTMGGKHPSFPKALPLQVNLNTGRITREQDRIQLESYEDGFQTDIFTSERASYEMFNSVKGACAFKDDFSFWQKNDYHHTAGKPFWIDFNEKNIHHIFFDDNLRIDEEDSIVDVRMFNKTGTEAKSLNCEESAMLEDVCLVQADLLESTEREDYFIDKVALCEKNFESLLNSIETKNNPVVNNLVSF